MSKSNDLNIDNYDLNDILALFKINADFDENDLKAAKKIQQLNFKLLAYVKEMSGICSIFL